MDTSIIKTKNLEGRNKNNMKRDETFYLNEILEQIELIENSTRGISRSDFEKNLDLRDATIRRIEIIGEAIKNISKKTKDKYPLVGWRDIAGTRDKIIHQYFRIDFDVVWEIIKKDIPILKKQMETIKKELIDTN